ncbi:transcription factor Jun-like [Mytilus galloprovincialis]|uniref:Transcription factor AP-1 n=1 Tax=Mytilus galloprovincialis TaxID=29158 RepID=A0A0C5PTA6_MYTGA|nr:transcription factor jun-like protein [Mytilus galloprovincialis]VDI65652.1 transcription factor AP-1 [Mytilus galloprovincialis]VDI81793.1 transcription factor AP-1 [Mytilus galloprovincialis]
MEVLSERTFYPEGIMNKAGDANVNSLKRKMTLDFNSSGKTKQQKIQNLLASPDLNMLKLASPELEKFIIQANGFVTTTPTPTQFIFPKFVTDEQESFAKGFVEALNNLHGKTGQCLKGESSSDCESDSVSNASYTYVPPDYVLTSATTTLPGGLITTNTSSAGNHSVKSMPSQRISLLRQDEEPQTVPSIATSTTDSFSVSPINMENQEVIKLERKRARNRVAARKCRTRKLERISRLEDRVDDLKGQNCDLTATANSLRDQVCKLKKKIIDHVNSGCQIMISSTNIFS